MPGTGTRFFQNIFCGIYISIMRTATVRTNPIPYSKVCDTFRPRIGQSAAIRADLGAKRFIHLFKPRAMLNSLVRQLSSEGRPARIQNGLRHAGPGESGGVDVAYRDVIKFFDEAHRKLVVKVAAPVSYLRVNRFHALFLARPLRCGQYRLRVPVDALRADLFTRGQGGEVFQAQINAHAVQRLAHFWRASHVNHDIQKTSGPGCRGKSCCRP